MPDRNIVRCLEHCVQQLTQLTGLLDAVLTKCCNLVVPDALSEMEEKYKGIGTVSLYFQVVQWFLRVGLLPERQDSCHALSYPGEQLISTYNKRRVKLHRLQDPTVCDENAAKEPCPLLYIDQLIEEEFGGDRIHQMWIRGGSESHGLYPPPSLYALLRVYLLPDIAEEHKHSLVLYLLVDYSMVYDEVRYESVIRRLMQFPTMFGLSNTAIKATQAFWHLDHRDFDFALDQLQCLTGNNLSYWQHGVVLSSLLAQKKTQAALQYLHVRKPPPPTTHANLDKVNDNDKLEDWQSCCNLYLARGLVCESLDVVRMCVQNAPRIEDKAFVLNFFFKSCQNTGQLSKLLQASLLPFEEDVFIKYLENCNEAQTSDILIMYYLQLSRHSHHVLPAAVTVSCHSGCHNTGQLSKLLQASLLPFEEDVFIKYLENCNEAQTSDILIMYYLQLSRHSHHVLPAAVTVSCHSGCHNTGQLSKLLQASLLPFEEDVFIKYLENCNEAQTSDILIMYYLQLSRHSHHVLPAAVTVSCHSGCHNTGQLSKLLQASLLPFEEDVFIKYLENCNEAQTSDILIMYYLQLSRHSHHVLPAAVTVSCHSGCHNTGQLSKLLQASLLPFEEDVFIKYLENCNEAQTSDILIMYYLQLSRHSHHVLPAAVTVSCHSGCHNTGQLSKLLQASLLPFEEDVFIKYLENCNEAQTSDILIMYYLQLSRYLEAEQYNKRIKQSKPPAKDYTASAESLTDLIDRQGARDTLVEVLCSTLPAITNTVAHSINEKEWESHIFAPKPMSVFIQAKSPKNTFVYKSSFIQDTIENASETWMKRPKARKGLKRALNIEETPFICTPKLNRSKSIFNSEQNDSTPPKRARLELTTPRTPRTPRAPAAGNMSQQLSALLEMPELHSPDMKYDRGGAGTPHSILKIRTDAREMAVSPVDSRYLGDSEDELLETASNHTHYSDSTNKHLRFTIPTASESGSTPSPTPQASATKKEQVKEQDVEMSPESFATTESHAMNEPNPLESPPKKIATEEKCDSRKKFKDTVRARRSLSISANSSLSDDPNTSVESIADIPITLINVRYSGEKRRSLIKDTDIVESASADKGSETLKGDVSKPEVPKTPRGRRSIRPVSAESTPLMSSRSRSVTPERMDSPVAVITPLRPIRNTRSRSRTPEISPRSSPLSTIPEQPKQEVDSEPHPTRTTLSVPRRTRSRSRTPERIEKVVESPRLEAITESPTRSSDSPTSSPARRSLRSRSRTPEVEPEKTAPAGSLSPRTLRSRAKTPEKLMSPKKDAPKSAKKPLSRLVLEANAIAASKNLVKQLESKEEKSESAIECTPMKTLKSVSSLMDVTISPIVSKSILHSPNDSVLSESIVKDNKTAEDETLEMKSLPAFTMNETKFGKSVLHSYESSMEEVTEKETKTEILFSASKLQKSIPAFTLSESYFQKSVLHSYTSSAGETSGQEDKEMVVKESPASSSFNITDFNKSVLASHDTSLAESQDKKDKNMSSLITDDSETEDSKAEKGQDVVQKEKEKIVEIEREINEIEQDMSEEDESAEEADESDEGVEESSSSSLEFDGERDDLEDDSGRDSSDMNSVLPSEYAEGEEEEVISIVDTDDSSNNLTIDEDSNKSTVQKEFAFLRAGHSKHDEDSNEGDSARHSNEKSTSDSNECCTDPLNQAQMSVLTDDNSVNTDSKLAEESKVEKDVPEINNEKTQELAEKRNVKEDDTETSKEKTQETIEGTNPLDQAQISLLTNDDSVHSDTSEAKLKYSDDENIEKADGKDKQELPVDIEMKPVENTFQIQVTVEAEHIVEDSPEMPKANMEVSEQTKPSADVVDASAKEKDNVLEKYDVEMSEPQTKDDAPKIDVRMQSSESENTEKAEIPASRGKKRTKSTSSTKSYKEETSKFVETKLSETESKSEDTADESVRKPARRTTKRTKSTSSAKSNKDESTKVETKSPDTESKSEDTASEDIGKPATRTQRTRSTSSNKSKDETIEPKTPVTRKRSQSQASNKSEEQTTPEEKTEPGTPSRRRAKTPTSTATTSSTGAEVRRILTRRASKELNQSVLDDSSTDDTSLTPKRRSVRTRSGNIDDNASVASGDSVRSTRSRASKTSEDGNGKPQRKGKKSILAIAKPDLSVIPESAVEDSKADSKGEIIADYSSSRRLTRHQKSLLESWLEPRPSPARRRPSTASRTSVASIASEQEIDEDDASSTHSGAFDVQPIDRISLMNKGDFEGSPDSSEVQSTVSPDSIASDASKQRRARLDRAASESRSTPKARSIRRVSVDVAGDTSTTGSPALGTPTRGRRASFTRAVEALHTPKGRRTSTDVKRGENDSVTSSPPVSESSPPGPSAAPATPSRRPRRASSASNTSKMDTSVTGPR
ncbi:hypothetical protein O0L34_g18182 [Tuta absoluta]|nr:hypothetical protein O0L34_g18182 [Tuta absoluta]